MRGLNALAAVISTPLSAPAIAATRLRGGNAASARGAASLAVQAIGTARDCGCAGTLIVRMPDGRNGHPDPAPPRNPGQAAQQASGRTPTPAITSQDSCAGIRPQTTYRN